jgi:dihydroorotase
MSAPVVIRMPKPDDFHIHLRQGQDLIQYTKDAAYSFRRVLVMPNTLPPIKTGQQVETYRKEILQSVATQVYGTLEQFSPLLTFKLGADIPPDQVQSLKEAGCVAGKLYPQGATTHSEDGVGEIKELYPLLEAMEAEQLVLCIHGEDPSVFSLDREQAFLPKVAQIVRDFPRLRVVMEHITTKEAVQALNTFPDRVGATLTLHHLLCNLDHMIGGFLNPHLFCKPVLKAPEHQQALTKAVLQGHPRLFFGSDSAPHHKDQKESACGCAGVYTAPVALPLLTQFFLDHDRLDLFEPFVAQRGADFYGLPRTGSDPKDPYIEIRQEPWTVPNQYGPVVPYGAGQSLAFQVYSS